MSIYQKKSINANIKLGVWYINETIAELEKIYSEMNTNGISVPKTKSESRVKQWLATRLLLNTFFEDVDVLYNEYGKPTLSNGWHISISHSYEYVAILLNKNNACGIDIEKINPKVERIKTKFLSSTDLKKITSLEELTIYWGAKEALYKCYGKKEILFIEHLFISNFSTTSHNFNGAIEMPNFSLELNMYWEKIDDYILVYTL